jgi:hypothetical protein
MKKVILGFITGIITALAFTAFAASTELFTAQQATFDIYVEGEKFVSENPPVVIEGRTYLALRDTAEALNIEVYWNGDERKVEIGERKKTVSELPKSTAAQGKVFREFKQSMGTEYIEEIDGEYYASASVFGQEYSKRDGNIGYIEIPDREPVVVRIDREPTENSTKDVLGNIMVKLSSLGLEAEIQGDIVIIRYK